MKKNAILITGAHRSGTTWLGKIISHCPNVKYIHEPFNIGLKSEQSPLRHWFEYISEESDPHYQQKVTTYLRSYYDLSLGITLRNASKIRSPGGTYIFLKDLKKRITARPLIKDPIAIFSAEWLYQHLGCDVIVLIRHPAAFVASLKVKDWQYNFNEFLKQKALMDTYLSAYADEITEYSRKPQDIIRQGVLLWKVIYSTVHQYREKYRKDWHFVRHEDISRDPLTEFGNIFTFLNLDFAESVQKELIKSTTATANTDLARNSRENIYTWSKRLSQAEIALIMEQSFPVWKHFYTQHEWNIQE